MDMENQNKQRIIRECPNCKLLIGATLDKASKCPGCNKLFIHSSDNSKIVDSSYIVQVNDFHYP